MNWNRFSTCSNKSTLLCGKLWGITPRGKLAAIRQRYCSCELCKWNRVCLFTLFSGLAASKTRNGLLASPQQNKLAPPSNSPYLSVRSTSPQTSVAEILSFSSEFMCPQ